VSDGKGGNASDTVYIYTDQNSSSGNPIISVTGTREVNEGSSIPLNVSAYDPNGYSLTYSWTCSGGSLSSYYVLNPNYVAPMVNSDTNYYCTITATNNKGASSTANVNILVKDSNSQSSSASISTNAATNVTTTSATLNGKLSGNSMNVGFEWGRISGSMTTVDAGYKNSGESFSSSVSDLEKGKAYQFKARGQGTSGTIYGSVQKFITKPEAPSYFNASLSSNTKVNLTWTKGEGAYYTTVTRKIGSYPQTATDGSVVYYGTGSSFTDSVSSGQYYYYRAWSVAYDGGLYAWSDSDYARDYVVTTAVQSYNPVAQVIQSVAPTVKKVAVKVEEEEEEETDLCAVLEDVLSVKITGENVTQGKEPSRNVNARPGDEVNIQIEVTSSAEEKLENVALTNILPSKIAEVSNIEIDGDSVGLNLNDGVILGTLKPNESKTMSFTIKLADEEEFTQKETNLVDSVEVSGKNIEPANSKLTIKVTNSNGSSSGFASVFSLFGGNWLWVILLFGLFLFILLLILLLIYLFLLLKKKDKEEKEKYERENYSAQRSKYFQIQ
jgi:hypothetical protein